MVAVVVGLELQLVSRFKTGTRRSGEMRPLSRCAAVSAV